MSFQTIAELTVYCVNNKIKANQAVDLINEMVKEGHITIPEGLNFAANYENLTKPAVTFNNIWHETTALTPGKESFVKILSMMLTVINKIGEKYELDIQPYEYANPTHTDHDLFKTLNVMSKYLPLRNVKKTKTGEVDENKFTFDQLDEYLKQLTIHDLTEIELPEMEDLELGNEVEVKTETDVNLGVTNYDTVETEVVEEELTAKKSTKK